MLWFRIIRPQTLFASLCPVLVGCLCSLSLPSASGQLTPYVVVVTILCALALQILSNLYNDYYDFLNGADSKGRVGFKRALAEGQVTVKQMRTACNITLVVAVLLGALLVAVGGYVILGIGLTALLFAWLYSATSHSLSYLGIADIFVFLYYGVIASVGTTWLLFASTQDLFCWTDSDWWSVQVPAASDALLMSFYAGAVNGLISMCVLAINNIRDIEDDRQAGKRTLPVRVGKTTALVLFAIVVLLTPLFAYLAFGFSWAMLVVLPGVFILYRVIRAYGAEYNICLLLTGIWNLIYAGLVALTVL